MSNGNLTKAKQLKNDEFYTQLTDIEKELKYYKNQFSGKTVYCNCDDARESNFFRYFSMNFEFLGLKKLICTGYNENGKGSVLIYEGDKNGNLRVDDEEIITKELNGNGDFASEECIEFLKESDIVVTNPPFSSFRIYIKLLMDYNKKFLVIGNKNAITYKEIFPYIKDGKLRTGKNSVKEFKQPDGTMKKFGNIGWFTNLETHKADNPIQIIERYNGNESKYPHYDNYGAINCDKIVDFPIDLPIGAVVGVPITIVDKIADDGFIYFDDCGMNEGLQKYETIGEMANTNIDENNFGYPYIGGGDENMQESLSSVSDNRCSVDSENCKTAKEEYNVNKGQRLGNQWGGNLCESNYQAYKVIDCKEPAIALEKLRLNPNFKEYKSRRVVIGNILCQKTYHRIFIQKIK